MKAELMDAFFTARVDGYDEHMLRDVPGCREAYAELAVLVPAGTKTLLDLGCGTGLELEPIFRRLPDVAVTGIDLTPAMLERLKAKFPNRKLTLIAGDYLILPLGESQFDCAVSFQSLHHFSHAEKIALYRRILASLKAGGAFVYCDYMLTEQREEDFYYAELARIRRESSVPEGELIHYDTPCTVENETAMLLDAGFSSAVQVFRKENTTIIYAAKA